MNESDIWSDPGVKDALADGRPASDIAVLSCPACGKWGYYNQGSTFWCRFCEANWYCCSDSEAPPLYGKWLRLEDFTTLEDLTCAEDGP